MMNKLSILIALPLCGAMPVVLAQPISTEAWFAARDPSGTQVVHIHCGPNFLDPREVVVKKGVPVRITVEATGGLPQSFGFSEPGFPGRAPVEARSAGAHFVPGARGRAVMSCESHGAPPDAPEQKARKRGVLTVID